MKEKNIYDCPVQATVNTIAGKWKIYIIFYLLNGTKRFGELKKAIPGITQKMLTQQLRDLEEKKIINRKVYPQVPPKVEYMLTEIGFKLKKVIDLLCEWGQEYNENIRYAMSSSWEKIEK